jgi:hypothetical protein
MRTALFALTATAAFATAANAGARLIVEDFTDGMGGAAFDSELNWDFGTATDFTGGLDTHDLFVGELYMYADLATVSVNSLAAGEFIDVIEVTWTDFCGVGCTQFTVNGIMGASASQGNVNIGTIESWTLSSADIGEAIDTFELSSFEGRIERVEIRILPTPSTAALVGLGGLVATRRRRN